MLPKPCAVVRDIVASECNTGPVLGLMPRPVPSVVLVRLTDIALFPLDSAYRTTMYALMSGAKTVHDAVNPFQAT